MEKIKDLIYRQDAIDAVIKRDANCGIDSAEVLKDLPPAQPEITNKEIRFSLKQLRVYLAIKIRDGKEGSVPVELLKRVEEIQKYFENVLSAQPEPDNDWVPVTKKAHPDEEGEYLVTDKGGGLATLNIDDFIFCDDGTPCWLYSQNVVAWKLPPKPYTERKEE